MKNAGIIMECNPFHEGHQYIIGRARERTGSDGSVIVVMSGDFAQRGIPAVVSKEERTRSILEAGADLVLELPVRYAVSGAGYFAEGGISLLLGTGIITDLIFGSECGDLSHLADCARFLAGEPEDYRQLLRKYLADGLSFPLARAAAASNCAAHVNLPDSPNDLLGVEYLKALLLLEQNGSARRNEAPSGRIQPHAIARIRSASASSLRSEMQADGRGMFADDFSGMLLEKLLMIDHGICRYAYTDYADVSRDLGNRIHRVLAQFVSWTQFCTLVKTRNVTYTAVSRALLHILLDLTKDRMPTASFHAGSRNPDVRGSFGDPALKGVRADAPDAPEKGLPYARVLGCRREKLALLGIIQENGLPLITSRSEADRLLPEGTLARQLLDLDIRASETWNQAARMKACERCAAAEGAASAGTAKTAERDDSPLSAVSEFSRPLLIV